eukprot:4942473-Prymnesium_polylepis.2
MAERGSRKDHADLQPPKLEDEMPSLVGGPQCPEMLFGDDIHALLVVGGSGAAGVLRVPCDLEGLLSVWPKRGHPKRASNAGRMLEHGRGERQVAGGCSTDTKAVARIRRTHGALVDCGECLEPRLVVAHVHLDDSAVVETRRHRPSRADFKPEAYTLA